MNSLTVMAQTLALGIYMLLPLRSRGHMLEGLGNNEMIYFLIYSIHILTVSWKNVANVSDIS